MPLTAPSIRLVPVQYKLLPNHVVTENRGEPLKVGAESREKINPFVTNNSGVYRKKIKRSKHGLKVVGDGASEAPRVTDSDRIVTKLFLNNMQL